MAGASPSGASEALGVEDDVDIGEVGVFGARQGVGAETIVGATGVAGSEEIIGIERIIGAEGAAAAVPNLCSSSSGAADAVGAASTSGVRFRR